MTTNNPVLAKGWKPSPLMVRMVEGPPSEPVHWGLGFQVSAASGAMLTPTSFGHPGAGGSIGFADPSTGVSFGYVMNKLAEPYVVDRERKRIEINSGGPAKDLVEALRTCRSI